MRRAIGSLTLENCAEWFIADFAMMMGGFVSVPIYPTANSETIRYVLEHSESKAIFIGKLIIQKTSKRYCRRTFYVSLSRIRPRLASISGKHCLMISCHWKKVRSLSRKA
ncbi:AMP-binding protein [Plesiomonas shigelloides]|nr:AMP-binding protein [Plesiomonas shigelloides]